LAWRQIEKPSWRWALLLILTLIALFFAHAQLMLMAVGFVGIMALCAAQSGRRWWTLLTTVGPAFLAFLPGLPWYLSTLQMAEKAGGLRPHFPTVVHNLEFLAIHTFDILLGSWDIIAGVALTVGLVVLLVLRPRREEPFLRRHTMDLMMVVAGVSYFVLPSSIRDQSVINGRHAVLTLLLLAVAIDVDPKRRVSRWVLRGVVLFTFLYGLLFAEGTLRMGEETGDLSSLFARLKPGVRLLYTDHPRSKAFRLDVYRHMGSYAFPWKQGVTPDVFASRSIQPIRLTPAWRVPWIKRNPTRSRALDSYDALLTGRRYKSPRLRLLGHSGVFYLYEVVKTER
jgi:hypothetical protein